MQEYETGTSSEALIVSDLDKFDMVFQAFEYETGMCTRRSMHAHTYRTVQCMHCVCVCVCVWMT